MRSSSRSERARATRSAFSPCCSSWTRRSSSRQALLYPLLDAPHRGAVRCGGLLGLGELALQGVGAPRQLASVILSSVQPLFEALDLDAALAVQAQHPLLRLDAQLLLGVLALLDAPELALALERRSALVLERLAGPRALLLGLAQSLLQAGNVAFERLHGRFGGLRAAHQRDLAALGGAARAAFGQQIALATARATLGPGAVFAVGRLASLHHHVAANLRVAPDVCEGALAAVRGAARSGADVGREMLAGERFGCPPAAEQVGGRALEDDPAAVVAGARAEVDDPVGVRHHRLVVRDHDH